MRHGAWFAPAMAWGDSLVEKEAAQACARFADLEGKPSLCKTIKLIGDPSLKQLKPSCMSATMRNTGPWCATMSRFAIFHVRCARLDSRLDMTGLGMWTDPNPEALSSSFVFNGCSCLESDGKFQWGELCVSTVGTSVWFNTSSLSAFHGSWPDVPQTSAKEWAAKDSYVTYWNSLHLGADLHYRIDGTAPTLAAKASQCAAYGKPISIHKKVHLQNSIGTWNLKFTEESGWLGPVPADWLACSVSLRLFVSRYESRYESRYVVSALLFDSCATWSICQLFLLLRIPVFLTSEVPTIAIWTCTPRALTTWSPN